MSSLFRKKSITKIVADSESGLSDGHGGHSLNKVLEVKDLTFMGIEIGRASCRERVSSPV